MSDTTNILELPTENDKRSFNEPTQQQGVALDENTISQIVSGLQRASVNGATLLPSRDIPAMPTSISNDAQVQPNYVPPAPKQNDYIKNQEENDDISNNYNKRMETNNSLDDMYTELQTPLLLMVLYFLFQLRFYRKFLFNYFPILFSKDGNININGLFFNSILFGFTYYALNKGTEMFERF